MKKAILIVICILVFSFTGCGRAATGTEKGASGSDGTQTFDSGSGMSVNSVTDTDSTVTDADSTCTVSSESTIDEPGNTESGSIEVGYYVSENQWSVLEIKQDNRFLFCRCTLMSYAPSGRYEISGDEMKLTDVQGQYYDFSFTIHDGKLIYNGDPLEGFISDGDALTYCGTEYPELNHDR